MLKKIRFETKRKYQSSELDRVAGRHTSHAELERPHQDAQQDKGGREDTEDQLPGNDAGGAGGSSAREGQARPSSKCGNRIPVTADGAHLEGQTTWKPFLHYLKVKMEKMMEKDKKKGYPKKKSLDPSEEEVSEQEDWDKVIPTTTIRLEETVHQMEKEENREMVMSQMMQSMQVIMGRLQDLEQVTHPLMDRIGPSTIESSRSKGQSTSPELGQGSTDKRLKTGYNQQLKVCQIVMYVGPRDVHVQKHEKNSGSWMVNRKTKRSAEVDIRNMTEEEHELMKQAKGKEIESYIDHAAVEIAGKCGVDPKRIMGMRWVLTWKNETNENGQITGKKAKARLIIKGFQDPDLLRIQRDSPTLSTLGRNLLFSITSKQGWEMWLGDIKTAFLNGDDTEYDRKIYGEPLEDVKEYLGMSPTTFSGQEGCLGFAECPKKVDGQISQGTG